MLKPALGKYFMRPYLKNTQHKKGLVEWLKWQGTCLSSNPSAAKQTNKQTNQTNKKNQGRAQGTNASQWLSQTPQPVREAAIAVLGSFLLLFLTLFYALFF
jgi:hypothetical protein